MMIHDFYIFTLWIHYTLFNSVLTRSYIYIYIYIYIIHIYIKNIYINVIYIHIYIYIYIYIYILTSISKIFDACSNFIKILFHWWCFITITISLIFNIIVATKITNSCWFVINLFLFKKAPNISDYYMLDCFVLAWFFHISPEESYISHSGQI